MTSDFIRMGSFSPFYWTPMHILIDICTYILILSKCKWHHQYNFHVDILPDLILSLDCWQPYIIQSRRRCHIKIRPSCQRTFHHQFDTGTWWNIINIQPIPVIIMKYDTYIHMCINLICSRHLSLHMNVNFFIFFSLLKISMHFCINSNKN